MSEEEFLQLIDKYFPKTHPGLCLGRGDDCAVLCVEHNICLSSDLFLEGIHFKRDYFSAQDIGYKSLAANLSDIAAMGAKPLGFSLSLLIPRDSDLVFWEGYLQGLASLASEYDLFLAGGDLSAAPVLGMDLTILGRCDKQPLLRQKVSPGDLLFVLGRASGPDPSPFLELGLSRVGLHVLEAGMDASHYPQSVRQHLRPQVLVHEGRILSGREEVIGLMDLSDGLARDLPRFLDSGLGAELKIEESAIHPEVMAYALEHDQSPFVLAFLGGEDYLLLGGVGRDSVSDLTDKFPSLRIIGEVVAEPLFKLNGQVLDLRGFDHFSDWS